MYGFTEAVITGYLLNWQVFWLGLLGGATPGIIIFAIHGFKW